MLPCVSYVVLCWLGGLTSVLINKDYFIFYETYSFSAVCTLLRGLTLWMHITTWRIFVCRILFAKLIGTTSMVGFPILSVLHSTFGILCSCSMLLIFRCKIYNTAMWAVLSERALSQMTSSLLMSTVREARLWYNLSNNFIYARTEISINHFTARRYANAVYAVVMCPSVYLSVTSRNCTKTPEDRKITEIMQ